MKYLIHYLDGRTAWREMGSPPPHEWHEIDEDHVIDVHGKEHPAAGWFVLWHRDGNLYQRILRFVGVQILFGAEPVLYYYQVPDDWKPGDPVPGAPL